MTKIKNNNYNNQKKNRQFIPRNIHNRKQTLIDLKSYSIQELYNFAEQYYNDLKNNNKNDKWQEFITQKGTKKDKITFIAAEILKKPQTCLEQFEILAKWTLDSNENFSLQACQALSNIYIEHVFVQRPSLKIFLDCVQQYIKNNKKDSIVGKGDLIGFYLQHKIKHYYGQMIRGLTQRLKSTIIYIKKTSIQILSSLSRFKQFRRTILSILINKFGDQDMEVVNQVTKNLKTQFYSDIQASQTLLQEVQTFLFRSHLNQKSQFYVINFLNNINLKYFSQKSLSKIFELFFHFFNKLMQVNTQQKSISSRLFLNSIKGLNKIFKFIKIGNKETLNNINQKVQEIYKTFHKTNNTKAKVQLLLFLFQCSTHINGIITDRFYRILYEFLNSNEILYCSIVEIFFDLLLISMKQDQNLNRTLAFIKRLLQLCFQAQSNFIATCLILISKVIQEKESIQIMIRQKQNILQNNQDVKENPKGQKSLPYDMNKRQPLFAGAEKTNIWQLTVFQNHYHPTVRKFTQHILMNEQIPYQGSNPLLQLSLTSFVQKMSLRKQKKSDSWKIKVKHNLQRIRTSKYQSIIQKPLNSFKQNQQFIKKYLEKRQFIHQNIKKLQPEDIEDFADQIIQKQIERLNPKQDGVLDDLSISREEVDEQDSNHRNRQDLPEESLVNDQNSQKVDENLDYEDDQEVEDQKGDEDLQGDEEQYGMNALEKQNKSFGDQFENEEDDFDEDIDQEQDRQNQSSLEQDDKQFQDAFNDIDDSPSYPKKKKSINRQQQKFNNNKKKYIKNQKKVNFKQKKKEFMSKSKQSFKTGKKR